MPDSELESPLLKLALLSERARKDPKCQFISLAHWLDERFLAWCSYRLGKDGAGGIDGVMWKAYGEHLEENLRDLVARLKAKRYRPQPAKRVYIPKDEHSQRSRGTPHGGNFSPLLSNVYLHYVRFENRLKREIRGACRLVRYTDDFAIMAQYQDDAQRMMQALRERFAKFALELHPEKTRVIGFGKYERENARRQKRRPNTFDFLGFTHYCGRNRGGTFKVGRKTSRKKFRKKSRELGDWLRKVRNLRAVKEW
jgi:hypothetical protein